MLRMQIAIIILRVSKYNKIYARHTELAISTDLAAPAFATLAMGMGGLYKREVSFQMT